MQALDRFMKKVVVAKSGCWDWVACLEANGYGAFSIDSKANLAHRVSWILHKGDIPDNLYVLHRCDNRKCVNPAHLFLGTRSDNSLGMVSKNRQVKGEQIKQSKLNAEAILSIRKDPRKNEVIAKQYEVSSSLISRVKNERIWNHV